MRHTAEYWNMPPTEQQIVATEIKEQAKALEPATIPTQCTLENALNTGYEFAICACMLFTIIVQDRYDLGGGYSAQITAMGQIHTEFFNDPSVDLETVETWLEENAPYTAHAPVWVPLPTYNSHKHETEYLNKLWPKHK